MQEQTLFRGSSIFKKKFIHETQEASLSYPRMALIN